MSNALIARLRETIDLLNAYGEAKLGDDWWPGNAGAWIGEEEGRRLEYLLACVDVDDASP